MACVYIIRHKHSNNSYIGSTKNFKERMRKHKDAYKFPNHQNYNHRIYRFIRENDGWDNFDVVKICDCEEDERLKMEQYHMDFVKPTLNDARAYGLDIERKKIKQKEWNENHLESVRNSKKKWKDNPINREKYNKWRREYRKQKVICDCGKEVSRGVMEKARRTGTHNHQI